jgi:hypothetical protein
MAQCVSRIDLCNAQIARCQCGPDSNCDGQLVPRLGLFVVGLSPRWFRVGFVVDRVTMGRVCLRVQYFGFPRQYYCISAPYSFVCH